jgi:Ca2+-binding EF-hand superfamily protein
LRALFLSADSDGNGFLSAEELFNVIKDMGADVKPDDII